MRSAEWHPFKEKLEGLPVDTYNDAQSQERHAQQGAQQGPC